MRRRHSLTAWQVYADLLTCVLGYFMLIAVVLIIVPHAKKSSDGIKPKAEYLLVLGWDDKANIDLDLWLHHKDCTVYYQSRECANISLDRDSRGYISNLSENPDGTPNISPNQEVIAIRAVMPGDYLTAVNYYKDQASTSTPIDCTVELIKVNPTVTIIKQVKLHFDSEKQTFNAIAFHVDADGKVTLQSLPPEDLIRLYAQ